MRPNLDNPFRRPPRSKKEAEDISELLVGKGGKEKKEEDAKVDLELDETEDIELSEGELETVEELEYKPFTEEEMIAWGKKWNLPDSWMEEMTQNEDGTWKAVSLNFRAITDPKDFPNGIIEVTNFLMLDNIENAKGLKLPEKIHDLDLNGLKNAKNLFLPDDINQIDLMGLETAKDLVLPKNAKAVFLGRLRSAEYLDLPEGVIMVNLDSLTSIDHLRFPDSVKEVSVEKLPEDLKEILRSRYPDIIFDHEE